MNEKGFSEATQHKDKLLEFDRTSACRTKVIDDESDYFNVNSQWISEKERVMLKEKEKKYMEEKHSRNKKITLDFAGRMIIEEEAPVVGDLIKYLRCYNDSKLIAEHEDFTVPLTSNLTEDRLSNPMILVPPPTVSSII